MDVIDVIKQKKNWYVPLIEEKVVNVKSIGRAETGDVTQLRWQGTDGFSTGKYKSGTGMSRLLYLWWIDSFSFAFKLLFRCRIFIRWFWNMFANIIVAFLVVYELNYFLKKLIWTTKPNNSYVKVWYCNWK